MEEETGITLDHNEVKFAYAVNTIFPDISKQYVTVSALGESMAHDVCVQIILRNQVCLTMCCHRCMQVFMQTSVPEVRR